MPNYNDIVNAFGDYCDAAFDLRLKAYNLGEKLVKKIIEVGQIPKGFLKPVPVDLKQLDENKVYSVAGAMQYNIGLHLWEFGLCLEVSRGESVHPHDLLMLTVLLKQSKGEYTLSLLKEPLNNSLVFWGCEKREAWTIDVTSLFRAR
jgi:hypothetical protein